MCAVALARHAGARVIGTVRSPVEEPTARMAGAHEVVLNDQGLVERIKTLAPDGVDHIVEVAFGVAGPSDYFQPRFSIWRFLSARRMHYVIRVNSAVALLAAPEEGKRAIIAHELAHLAYYADSNRVRLLGLIPVAGLPRTV
jgi:threonine dehydrogenase-like Zn-dependent dehydrogenase